MSEYAELKRKYFTENSSECYLKDNYTDYCKVLESTCNYSENADMCQSLQKAYLLGKTESLCKEVKEFIEPEVTDNVEV